MVGFRMVRRLWVSAIAPILLALSVVAAAQSVPQVFKVLMEAEGFTVYPTEWWHFDFKDWRKYPIINLAFDKLAPAM
jgi:D-alanyl-D-alanine dipeptidase